jgi:hypothetical protein
VIWLAAVEALSRLANDSQLSVESRLNIVESLKVISNKWNQLLASGLLSKLCAVESLTILIISLARMLLECEQSIGSPIQKVIEMHTF